MKLQCSVEERNKHLGGRRALVRPTFEVVMEKSSSKQVGKDKNQLAHDIFREATCVYKNRTDPGKSQSRILLRSQNDELKKKQNKQTNCTHNFRNRMECWLVASRRLLGLE